MNHSKSILAGIISVLIWSLIPSLVKGSVLESNLILFLILRFVFATIPLVMFIPKIINKFRLINLSHWIALLGTLGANYYFQSLAMKNLPVTWYIVIFSLNPIVSLILLKARWNLNLLSSIVLAFIGTLVFVNFNQDAHYIKPLNLLFLLIGMLTWSLYTFLIKEFQKIYSDWEITALTNYTSLISIVLIGIITKAHIAFPTSSEISGSLVLGLSTIVAYGLYSYTMRHTPTFGVMSQYLEPVFGIIAGIMLFHENLSTAQLGGTFSIILSMYFATKSERSF